MQPEDLADAGTVTTLGGQTIRFGERVSDGSIVAEFEGTYLRTIIPVSIPNGKVSQPCILVAAQGCRTASSVCTLYAHVLCIMGQAASTSAAHLI